MTQATDSADTVFALVERQARAQPEGIYAVSTEGPQQITYKAVGIACRQVTALLQSHPGLPGETVSFVMPNGLFGAARRRG